MFFFSKKVLLDVWLATEYHLWIKKKFKVLTCLNPLKVKKSDSNLIFFHSHSISGCYIVKFTPYLLWLYSANTKNIIVTTLKINVIILFTREVQEKLWLCFLCHTSPLHFFIEISTHTELLKLLEVTRHAEPTLEGP